MTAAERSGLLAIISGPSGVGKSTVVSRLLEYQKEFWFSISVTTRPPRPNESARLLLWDTEGADG